MRGNPFDFKELLDRQRDIQRVFLNGPTPVELPPDRKMAFLMETGLALIKEMGEALDETGWKPWASSNHINSDAYRGELADVFIFLMNAMLIDGMTTDELWRLVEAKQQINLDRQRNGYDGVSTKCPGCKRAYDDGAVVCRPSTVATGGPPAWCAGAMSFFSAEGRAIPTAKALVDGE